MIKVKSDNIKYDPKLSQFWIVNGKFIGEKYPLIHCACIGDYVVSLDNKWYSKISSMHEFKGKSFYYYPRGRVRFNTRINQYEVFADKKIVSNEKVKDKIREELGLPSTTIFKTDEHYESIADVY